MAGVANRLSNLERLLPSMQPVTVGATQAAEDGYHQRVTPKEDASPAETHEHCSVDAVSMEHRQAFGNEILVQRGSRSQYFSEGFLARVIERVRY